MPCSPLTHELLITQDYWVNPGDYPKTASNPEGRHMGLDLRSPLDDVWLQCVPGFDHLLGTWPYLTGYGAAWAIDWGRADGGHYRVIYGHGKNRKKQYDGHHVGEGVPIAVSGATGDVRPRGAAGAHLHLEVREFDSHGRFLGYRDPKKVLLSHIPYRHA